VAAQANQPSGRPPGEVPEGTRLESDDEIRQAILTRRARLAGRQAPAPPGAAPAPEAEPEVRPETPVLRPPMALLCILDDGKLDGELFRLRADRTVLGRNEGDVRIPHDGMISSRHAEITRQRTASGYRWHLADLGSTNGTFVRIGSTILRPGNELVVGGVRYRFEAGSPAAGWAAPTSAGGTTQAWSGSPVQGLVPAFVEVTPAGPGQRHALARPEYWVGRDSSACPIARPDDLLLSPRHARLFRDAAGQWHIENNKSLNGLWLRIEAALPLQTTCQFRLGEQRFIFRVLR
jgi:pSer/pThr/pTyr-binding forkhead associated (FHA) protein